MTGVTPYLRSICGQIRRPLLYYYAFLNVTKAFLLAKGAKFPPTRSWANRYVTDRGRPNRAISPLSNNVIALT